MTTFFKPTGLLDLSTDPTSLPSTVKDNNEISGAMQRCKNLRLDEDGVAKTRDGSSVLDSGLSTDIHRIIEQAGDRYEFGGSIIYENGSSIKTGLTSAMWSGILYNAYNSTVQNVFALNGTDRKRIEGANVYEWGLEAPTVAPVIAAGALTGLTGDYNAKYTYCRKEDSVIVAESDPSPAGASAVTLADGSLDITFTASSDPQITHVRVYRTEADGLLYYHDQDIAIGTLTIDTNTADTALGTEVETDHDRPPLGSFVLGPNYNGTCFIIKDNLLYYCSPKQPEYWPVSNYIEVSPPQFPGQTAVFWNGQLYYITKNEIYLIQGTGVSTFFPIPMSAITGAQGIDCAVSVTGIGIYHVGVDGIYLFTNGNDKKISHVFMERLFRGETVNSVPGVDKDKLNKSWLIQFNNKLYFGYCGSTNTHPQNIIVFDMATTKIWFFDYGVEITAVAVDKTNKRLLAGDTSGNVYILEDSSLTKDNGEDIAWEIETKDFTMQTRKHFPRWTKYDVDASDSDCSATGAVIVDGSQLQSHVISGNRVTRRRLITTGNGDRVSLKITGTGPVSIHAMEFE
ncbi:MAG: hypothetical protein HN597_03610 [Desulfobacula sp.]|jgi:hypothetical protein|uniref:hypothetical protein n=1 Tax=Desulfobacula sp. TaxID=2593537 RepID=UPI0039B9510A|nr:hypothetical protein [Desulfobacula sp.]